MTERERKAKPQANLEPATESELKAALVEVERQLELVDEDENPVERTFKQERLWELQSQLKDDLDRLILDRDKPEDR